MGKQNKDRIKNRRINRRTSGRVKRDIER